MKEGFYFYRDRVYYGAYDESQVSGGGSVAAVKPERLPSNHPIGEGGWAARLWDNHRLLEPEYADLRSMLLKMRSFMDLNPEGEMDFSPVEERLRAPLPKELRRIYEAIRGREEYFTGPERFLPLDEIYVEQGTLVFFRKKRTPAAGYDLASGRLARYYKKGWTIEEDGLCCYQFCVGRMVTMALENRPVFKKGRCKGKFVSTLDIEKELENSCDENYRLLEEFNVYGIAVMYSKEGLIAWIRSNGSYADIHAGALEEAHLEAFGKHLGLITWQ